MARIAFFIERLPPDDDPITGFAYELVRSLADQQHEIRVFSTYYEGAELPPPHSRIEILRPFRGWSWLDLPKLMPLLFDFKPDVLHFVQPRFEARHELTRGWSGAMAAIPALAPILGRPMVVSSFYNLTEKDLRTYRRLILGSDAITVSNEPQLELLAKHFVGARARMRTVLPVPMATGSVEVDAAESAAMFGAGQDIVFVPGDISEHRDPERLFGEAATVLEELPNTAIVFGGGWGEIASHLRHRLTRKLDEPGFGARFTLTGPLSNETERRWLTRARIIFVGSLPPESMGLARTLREALHLSAPMVINETQVRRDALAWQNDENALITNDSPHAWANTLIRALGTDGLIEHIRARLPEFSRLEAIDQPANVMSRVYAKLLEGRAFS